MYNTDAWGGAKELLGFERGIRRNSFWIRTCSMIFGLDSAVRTVGYFPL